MGVAMLLFACAACGSQAQANPKLVVSVPARWDGTQYVPDPRAALQPLCEACARKLKARFEREGRPIPAAVREPDYFQRAYHKGADESDV
jgi:hypothetical protein